MPEATNTSTTPPVAPGEHTRRRVFTALGSLAAGVALTSGAMAITAVPAQPAENMDAELLAACAAYYRAHLAGNGDDVPFVSDAETDRLNDIRQRAMEAVVPFHPNTPEGLHAKAGVALSAMLFMVDSDVVIPWRERATPEETLVLDVLAAYRTGVA